MGGVLGRFHVVRGIQEFTASWWLTGAERGQAGKAGPPTAVTFCYGPSKGGLRMHPEPSTTASVTPSPTRSAPSPWGTGFAIQSVETGCEVRRGRTLLGPSFLSELLVGDRACTQLSAVQLAPRRVHETTWATECEPALTCPVKHGKRTCSREAVQGPRGRDFVGDAGLLLLLGILPGT